MKTLNSVCLRQNNSEAPLHGRTRVHWRNKSGGGFAEHRCDRCHIPVRHALKMQREEDHKFKASLTPINKIKKKIKRKHSFSKAEQFNFYREEK